MTEAAVERRQVAETRSVGDLDDGEMVLRRIAEELLTLFESTVGDPVGEADLGIFKQGV